MPPVFRSSIVIWMLHALRLPAHHSKRSYLITGCIVVTRKAGANSAANPSSPNSRSGTRYASCPPVCPEGEACLTSRLPPTHTLYAGRKSWLSAARGASPRTTTKKTASRWKDCQRCANSVLTAISSSLPRGSSNFPERYFQSCSSFYSPALTSSGTGIQAHFLLSLFSPPAASSSHFPDFAIRSPLTLIALVFSLSAGFPPSLHHWLNSSFPSSWFAGFFQIFD